MNTAEMVTHLAESNAVMRTAGDAITKATAELDRRADRIAKLEKVLRAIVDEYDNTYDGDCEGGIWTAAASIDVEVMERAKALLR